MGRGVWDIVIFTINGFVFMLIGLQLPSILDSLAAYSPLTLAGWGLAISLTVIVARIVWVFPATYLPRRLSARIRASDPYPPPRAVFVVSWAGMRGAVSLAAALALPLEPRPFPERDLVIFLTFCVIVATLVGQGLTLPWSSAGSGSWRPTARTRRRPMPGWRPSRRPDRGSTTSRSSIPATRS